jgi:predicted TIM-barrel fold metal-dependent hydrolase
MGAKSGFGSVEEHLDYSQRLMAGHVPQPVRRAKDSKIVTEQTLWDPDKPGSEGKYDVTFRVGKFGRFEWTKDGVGYYIQFLPPSLQNMEAPPGLLKTAMEYAGVSKSVLSCGGAYGKLNYYYAMVLRDYPDLFIPLADVDEKKAYQEEQIAELRNCITNLGLRGLYFVSRDGSWSERKFEPFWDEVRDLNIPVFWYFSPQEFFESMKRLGEWMGKHSTIPCVIVQAFRFSSTDEAGGISIPDYVQRSVEEGNIYLELAYPISRGNIEDYPYPESRRVVRQLYETFGGGKLVWGSDFPNVERYCTYAQSLNYLKDYCRFIRKGDMELILAKNIQKIFNLA